MAASPTAVAAQMIFHGSLYRYAYLAVVILHLALAIWEPPADNALQGSALAALRAADFVCLAVFAGDLALQYFALGRKLWLERGWVRVKAAAVALLCLNLIAHLAAPGVPYAARALRPLLLVERLRNVRRVASNVAATVPKILNVLILLAIHVLLFAVLGFALFAGIDGQNCSVIHRANAPTCSTFADGCQDYFGTLDSSAMQLFQLLTAANFPAVALPAYTCHPASMLYFLVFIAVGIWMLLSLTLAVTYATFRGLMAEEVVEKYRRMFENMDLAFHELTADEAGNEHRESSPAPAPAHGQAATTTTVRNPLNLQEGAIATHAMAVHPRAAVHDAAGSGHDVAAAGRERLVHEAGADPSIREWTSAPAGDRRLASTPSPSMRLTVDSFIAFFGCLRPDVSADVAHTLFSIFAPDAATAELDQLNFRRLLLHFSRLRFARLAGTTAPAGGLAGVVTAHAPVPVISDSSVARNPLPLLSLGDHATVGAGRASLTGALGAHVAPAATVALQDADLGPESAATEDELADIEVYDPGDDDDVEVGSRALDAQAAAAVRLGSSAGRLQPTAHADNPMGMADAGSAAARPPSQAFGVGPRDQPLRPRVHGSAPATAAEGVELPAVAASSRSALSPQADGHGAVSLPGTRHRLVDARASSASNHVAGVSLEPVGGRKAAGRMQPRPRVNGVSARCCDSIAAALSTRSTPDGYGVSRTQASQRRLIVAPRDGQSPPGACRLRAMLWLQNAWVTLLFDAAIIVNTIAVLVQLSTESDSGMAALSPPRRVQYAMMAVFLVSPSLRMRICTQLSTLRSIAQTCSCLPLHDFCSRSLYATLAV